MKKINWKTLIPYILIPVLFIGVIYAYMGLDSKKEVQYYQIVEYFDNGQVEEYDINLNSGAMTYKLKGDTAEYKYTVPNVSIFVEDVHTMVREYNKENPDTPIKYNYEAGTSNSWLISILPSALLTLGFVVLMVLMF